MVKQTKLSYEHNISRYSWKINPKKILKNMLGISEQNTEQSWWSVGSQYN